MKNIWSEHYYILSHVCWISRRSLVVVKNNLAFRASVMGGKSFREVELSRPPCLFELSSSSPRILLPRDNSS